MKYKYIVFLHEGFKYVVEPIGIVDSKRDALNYILYLNRHCKIYKWRADSNHHYHLYISRGHKTGRYLYFDPVDQDYMKLPIITDHLSDKYHQIHRPNYSDPSDQCEYMLYRHDGAEYVIRPFGIVKTRNQAMNHLEWINKHHYVRMNKWLKDVTGHYVLCYSPKYSGGGIAENSLYDYMKIPTTEFNIINRYRYMSTFGSEGSLY